MLMGTQIVKVQEVSFEDKIPLAVGLDVLHLDNLNCVHIQRFCARLTVKMAV